MARLANKAAGWGLRCPSADVGEPGDPAAVTFRLGPNEVKKLTGSELLIDGRAAER